MSILRLRGDLICPEVTREDFRTLTVDEILKGGYVEGFSRQKADPAGTLRKLVGLGKRGRMRWL